MASFHPAHLLSRGARNQNSHFLRKEGSRCCSFVHLGLWYPGSIVMGLALLRRERGCGERVYTTEILAELSQRAGTVQCESEALWKPGRAARLQRGCFSSLPLEPLLIVVLKRLDFGGFLPPLFFSKIRKGFIKPQVPLRRRRSRHLSFFPICDLLKKSQVVHPPV